jgi:hypothetical protein
MPRRGKTIVIVLLVCCAAVFIAIVWTAIATDDDDNSAPLREVSSIGDHWHAALGVNRCGEWLPPAPQFEQRANEAGVTAGIHSHGDGLIHLHPFASEEANDPTVDRFMAYGGWKLSSDSFTVWDDAIRRDGQPCATGGDGRVQWVVGQYGKPWPTEARRGDPADYRPKNGDIVAIYFLPAGSALPEPPDAQAALASISDLGGAPVRDLG